MESLALIVAIIVAPAMFGGPVALLTSLIRRDRIGAFRARFIYTLALLSIGVGLYLIFGGISRGALTIGLLGASTGTFAIYLTRRSRAATS